ncbi:MAG: hypothetical protein EA396_02535 [Anaerolineaceae bacterium]|nr:MAG: hypothetical protein EA396_02535 [Anaerolineaceae bacterium]
MTKKSTKPAKATEEEMTEEEQATVFKIFMDHQRKAAEEAGKALEGLVPTAVRDHGSAAFKEMVEGYRQLFNSALDKVVDRIEKTKVEEADDDTKKK